MIRWALLGVGLTCGGLGLAAVPDVTAQPEPTRRIVKADRLDWAERQPSTGLREPTQYTTDGPVTRGFDRTGRVVFEVHRALGYTIVAKGYAPHVAEAAGAGRLPAF